MTVLPTIQKGTKSKSLDRPFAISQSMPSSSDHQTSSGEHSLPRMVSPRSRQSVDSALGQINKTGSQRNSGNTTETEDTLKDDDVGLEFTPGHVVALKLPLNSRKPISLVDSPTNRARIAKPYELQNNPQNDVHSNSRLHRIYSDTETSNFDSINGRRMFDDDRYRPHKIKHDQSPVPNRHFSTTRLNLPSRSLSQNYRESQSLKRSHDTMLNGTIGMEDEYIPNLDFSSMVQKWANDSQIDLTKGYDSSFDSSFNESGPPSTAASVTSATLGQLHAQVQPVSVPVPKRDHFKTDLTNEEEDLVSKLPDNFVDLPFSVRRKMLIDLAPDGNTEAINKVVKKKFKRKTSNSPAMKFLNSFTEKSSTQTNGGQVILNHKVGSIIGGGAWGLVREGRSTTNNEINAIKIIHTKTPAVKRFFRKEVAVWHEMHHSNILPLLNIEETPGCIYCLTIRANGGTLYDLVSKWGMYNAPTSPFNRLEMTKNYVLQVVPALQYMHSRGYVHGDVKLENVLLHHDSNGTKVYLCDFGMSLKFKDIPIDINEEVHLPNKVAVKRRPSIPRSSSGTKALFNRSSSLQKLVIDKRQTHDDTRLSLPSPSSITAPPPEPPVFNSKFKFEYPEDYDKDDPNIPHTHIGSLPYAAPELLESSPVPLGPSADIWAFGVMLYTMIVGKLPFQHQYEPRLRAMISAGRYESDVLQLAAKGDSNLINAVKGCLITDLTKRLNFEQILELLRASPF